MRKILIPILAVSLFMGACKQNSNETSSTPEKETTTASFSPEEL